MRAMRLALVTIQCLAALAAEEEPSCGTGEFPKAGNCVPVIGKAVSELYQPNLTITRDDGPAGSEQITFTVALDALPQTWEIFEERELSYAIDVAPTEAELVDEANIPSDDCRPKWSVSAVEATLVIDYTDLSLECAMSASNDGELITRHGVIGIYIVSNRADNDESTPEYEMIERRWSIDTTVTFNATTLAHIGIHVNGDIELAAERFHLGGFVSELTIFTAVDFQTPDTVREFEVGDPVYVEHALRNRSVELDLDIIRVWLSTSVNPEDAARHDLTSQVLLQNSDTSEVQFTIIARRCEDCYLHCLSQISHLSTSGLLTGGERRLQGEDSAPVYSVQTLYVEMLPPTDDSASSRFALYARGGRRPAAGTAEGETPQSTGSLEIAVIVLAVACLLVMLTSAWLLWRYVKVQKSQAYAAKCTENGPSALGGEQVHV